MNTHEHLHREHENQGSSDRFFGLTFFAVLLLLSLWPLVKGRDINLFLLATAFAFLVAALAFPRLLAPLNKLWLQFGALLHSMTSPVILGVMFFLVITPIALLVRLTGKDLLHLRLDRQARTYWVPRDPPGPAKRSLDKQF